MPAPRRGLQRRPLSLVNGRVHIGPGSNEIAHDRGLAEPRLRPERTPNACDEPFWPWRLSENYLFDWQPDAATVAVCQLLSPDVTSGGGVDDSSNATVAPIRRPGPWPSCATVRMTPPQR